MARLKSRFNFTSGPLLKNMILYALPIIGINLLQITFTAADVAVLGLFTNDFAVAAVGATTQIINLIIGFFVGFSLGANVLIARYVGAKNIDGAHKVVGTSVFISVVFGFIILVVGILFSEQMLVWTNCDEEVLPYAAKYLRIYFLGMPIIMLYNFGASIMRAVGDATRPLIFLAVGGVVNIVSNIFFIKVVGLDIEGVAIATVMSNAISAIGITFLMIKDKGYAKLSKNYIRIDKVELLNITKIGLPISISKCLFSFANVMMQSNLNLLGDKVMTAHSITKEFDGYILETVHAIGAANLAVISQNFGAKNLKRVKQAGLISFSFMAVVCVVLGTSLLVFGRLLCGIMTETEEVLDYCMVRITSVSMFYILLGFLSVVQEIIRGIGYSFISTMLSILSNIVLRIIYLLFVYPYICIEGNISHNLRMLYLLYPGSWGFAGIVGLVVMFVLYKRVKLRFEREKIEKEQEQISLDNQEEIKEVG